MADRSEKNGGSRISLREFATVAFAEDIDLAEQYKKLLGDNDIPAAIKTQPGSSAAFPGIAVMVPEDYLDEAHVIIESDGVCDDFFDAVFHGQDSQDYEATDESFIDGADDF